MVSETCIKRCTRSLELHRDETDQDDQIWQILWIDCTALFLNAFLSTHARVATCVSQIPVQLWFLDMV